MMKHRRPLVWKVFFTFVATSVGITVVIGAFFRWSNGPRNQVVRIFIKNIANYSERLIDEIGVPPSEDKGRALATELGFGLRIEGPTVSWSTEANMKPVEYYRRRNSGWVPGLVAGRERGRFFFVRERGPYQYVFLFWNDPVLNPPTARVLALILGVLIVLSMSYWVVHWLLQPLRELSRATDEVAKGNLDVTVPNLGQDEFEQVAGGFRNMLTRIREMLSAKERLLLDVSHELRSPISRIRVAAEMVSDVELKKTIKQDAEELDVMVEELLEGYRLKSPNGALRKERAFLSDELDRIIEEFKKSGANVKFDNLIERSTLDFDVSRMGRVFRNLLTNATRHSHDPKMPIEIFLGRDSDHYIVRFLDHGPGIPSNELEKIFEPFYRTDPSRSRRTGGFGLGLAICRDIVEAHSGTISIKSELGRGTEVTVKMPL